MNIRSPLANLTELLEQVLTASELNLQTLQGNEAATRAVLIDPLLRSLGWNTGNPSMVEVEKTFLQARVDYALYDTNGEVKIIVEAKKLDANLNDQSTLLSLVNYAFTSGVKDIFLTDGLTWHHFSGFEPGKLAPSRILNLRKDSLVEIAAYLVQILDAARYWSKQRDVDELSQQINQLENTVSNLEKEIVRLKSNQFDEKPSITKMDERSQKEFTPLREIDNATGTSPSRLRLPDKTVLTINYWTHVLRECCKFAMEKNPHIPLPLPDQAGKKINLIDTVRPQKDVNYTDVEYQGKTVYIYLNYQANKSIKNAIHVLRQVPDDISQVPAAVKFA
jgi:predicted type IV restriction endonuclease